MNVFCKCLLSCVAVSCASGVFAATSTSDREFAAQAARDGAQEVELGRLAASQSNNTAVKEFGKRMVEDHTRAGEELQVAARQDGIDLPDEPAKVNSTLANLSGAQFDDAFARTMVEDHEKAVALFQREAQGDGDSNVKSFARKTLPTLEHHLEMARALPTVAANGKR